uniref:Beta-microseminoprotein E1-like n=1 Tax=Petromyzon marinus TaxID=7757 RepID=A0AAJ7SWV6_PETMA|nr:beta-microseminoprotein E1-like [Petromyzon marinus]
MAVTRVALQALVASVLVALSSGGCFHRRAETYVDTHGLVPVLVSSGCLDEFDALREDGERWRTSDCMACSCSSGMVRCCQVAFRPVMGFPASCEPILDTKKCVYTVVKKKNHKVKCPLSGPLAAVGK